MKYAAVTLDAMGTLVRPRESIGATYLTIWQQVTGLTLSSTTFDSSKQHLKSQFPLAFKEMEAERPNFGRSHVISDTNRVNSDTALPWWEDLITRAMPPELIQAAGTHVTKSFVKEAYEHFSSAEAWALFEDAKPTLNGLKDRDVPLAVVSNFDERLGRILQELDVLDYFDVVQSSWRHREAKPATSIYLATLKELSEIASGTLPASNVLHVGDDVEKDYLAATKASFQARYVSRDGSFHQDAPREHTIDSLEAIL